MSVLSNHINEVKAAAAFTKQSKLFDQLYGNDAIIQYKRARVREHILSFLKPGSSLLELNCGSGEDALFFASRGFDVHATDLSKGMLEVVREKIKAVSVDGTVSVEACSFTRLDQLENKGPFDHVYSNFGGLNCTEHLDQVLESLAPLVKPGGMVTLVIISKFCLWETLLMFRGKFKTAFRRFFSKNGRKARVEGSFFTCWYYAPSFIKKQLENTFDLSGLEGLCTLVPPSYIEGFAEKNPRFFSLLRSKENAWKSRWPWNRIGDYFIISFRKKSA